MKELREVKKWREDLRKIKEKVKEGIKEQGRELKREVEEMRREFRDMEGRWGKEREELRVRVKKLEEKMETLESGRGRGEEEEEGGKEMEAGVTERVKEIKRKMEWREKEESKKNIIMRGVEVKEEKRREAVERVLGMVGAKVDIQEVKRLRGDGDKEGEIILVKLGNEKQKREVMERKSKLRGRKEKIMEDWTWKER